MNKTDLFKATIKMKGYDESVFAYNFIDLKRKCSIIANKEYKDIDYATVIHFDENNNIISSFSMHRYNKLKLDNSIIRGHWL